MVKPSRRKEIAQRAFEQYNISIRLVCAVFTVSPTCYRYQPKLSNENAEISDWLLRLKTTNKRWGWGFGLCFLYLRNIKRFAWYHKRVYRIYRECELNLRIKAKRDKPETLSVPTEINQVWSRLYE